MAEEGGAPSGPLLRAVNRIADAIAEEFPRVVVSTLAYEYSRRPPTLTRPRRNVAIRLCDIDADFAQPMSHPRNAKFALDINSWHNATEQAHLHVWSYAVNFGSYLQPFPNYAVLGENIRWFAERGVTGVFMEGAPAQPGHVYSDLQELKNYVMAQMLVRICSVF